MASSIAAGPPPEPDPIDMLINHVVSLRKSITLGHPAKEDAGLLVTVVEKLENLLSTVSHLSDSMSIKDLLPSSQAYPFFEAGLSNLINNISNTDELPNLVAEIGKSGATLVGNLEGLILSHATLSEEQTRQALQLVMAIRGGFDELRSAANDIRDARLQALVEQERNDLQHALREAVVDGQENALASLVTDFGGFADAETKAKERNRNYGAGATLIAIIAAGILAWTAHGDLLSAEGLRLLIVTPVLAFSYYFIREAGHHREAAQRAKENQIRLKTILAYSLQLSAENRERLRYEFGQRVFNEKANPLADGEVDPKDLTSLLGAVTALVGISSPKARG